MRYELFLKERGSKFNRAVVRQGDAVVCVSRWGIDLTSHVWTLAQGGLDQRLVKDLGGYGVMHGHCDIMPLVEFRWKVDRWNELRIVVQYVKDSLGRTFICIHRGSHQWFAIARINQPNNALLLNEFFSTRRRHDGQGFGFCASQGAPARITNYRPDLLDKQTIANMYGYWLRWVDKRVGRGRLYYSAWKEEIVHGVGKEKSGFGSLRKQVIERIVNRPIETPQKSKVAEPASPPPGWVRSNGNQMPDGLSRGEAMQWYRDGYERLAGWQFECFEKEGKYEEARALVEKIIVVVGDKGESLAANYVRLGLLHQRLQEFEEASRAYRRALALEPKDSGKWYAAHHHLGVCLSAMHQYQEAESYLRQAIEIDPKWYGGYRSLGLTLVAVGEYAQAAKLFVQATILAPYHSESLYDLEELLDEHEVVYLQVPEIRAELEKCRQIVRRKGAA